MTKKIIARLFRGAGKEWFAKAACASAVSMIALAATAKANDLCTVSGTEQTCTGNQAGGITASAPVTSLVVKDITTDVEPATGPGINFQSIGQVSIDSDTGAYKINSAEDGIHAVATGNTPDATVTVVQKGDIEAGSHGIYAHSDNHNVSVDSNGNIYSYNDGIFASSNGDAADADVSVTHEGLIESTVGRGIYAQSDNQGVAVVNGGKIVSGSDGIFANSTGTSTDSTVSVMQTGDISAGGFGIYAASVQQTVTVSAVGNIVSSGDAIFAQSSGSPATATVTVNHSGTIDSALGRGIYAQSAFQTVSVTNSGTINSKSDGIFANGLGSASTSTTIVSQVGDVTSSTGYGIFAQSAFQKAAVTVEGNISSAKDGILAVSTGTADTADATVSHIGNINSSGGRGIYVNSAHHQAYVSNVGDVTANQDGIYVVSTGLADDATATVIQNGRVDSANGYGIYARSDSQAATISMIGDVTAQLDAIYAESNGTSEASDVSVVNTGDILSRGGRGIVASSARQSVSVTNTGDIEASGDAIFAQATGDSAQSTVSVVQSGDILSHSGFGIFAESVRQNVTVNAISDIISDKDGIFAQSTGDSATSKASVIHFGNITSQDGRGIYASSSRQAVTVENIGDIKSAQEGIFAQTSGDNEFATATVTQIGNIVAGNTGIYAAAPRQAVSVFSTGNIEASEFGIFAQTKGDSATAKSSIDHVGSVTMQPGGIGLYAEASVREAKIIADGNITGGDYGLKAVSLSTTSSITLNGGSVTGAALAAVSAASITGANVTNYGLIVGGAGNAIEVSGAESDVKNGGEVVGKVISVNGKADFQNDMDALFRTGSIVNLGKGTLNNDGTLDIGEDEGEIATTALTGDFVQSATGLMKVDLDLYNGDSDLLKVSGTADLDGDVLVAFSDFNGTLPQDYTFLTSDGLLTQNLDIANVVVQGQVNYVGEKDAVLSLDGLDFATVELSRNGRDVGNALNSAFNAVSPGMSDLMGALVAFTDAVDYAEALAQLTPELAATSSEAVTASNLRFSNYLMSCKTYTGGANVNREGECGWFAAEGFTLDYSPSDDTAAYDQSGFLLGGGFQKAVNDVWRVGLGVSYARTEADGYNSQADSDQFALGAVVKYDNGPLLLAADVTGGYVWSSYQRDVNFQNYSDKLTADATGAYVASKLRAAYTHEVGKAYLQPRVDVDLLYYSSNGYTEEGGDAALDVEGQEDFSVLITPALELGGDFVGKNSLNYRPYVRAGVIFNTDPETTLNASFANAAAGSGSFEITSDTDAYLGSLALGLDVITTANSFGRLVYEGQLGENTSSQSLMFKLGASF